MNETFSSSFSLQKTKVK